MTIHVLIPVFNRLEMTQSLVGCLRRQVLEESLRILVVNDGSSDGTDQWLATQQDIEVINGNGTLYWAGAIDLGLQYLNGKATSQDWVLFMNNDTTISEDFVQRLLKVAQANSPAAVGSVVRHVFEHERLLSIGARVDAWRFRTWDVLNEGNNDLVADAVIEVDALSGRGVLFPLASINVAGGMRPFALPHYLADYELSLRVHKSGWRLLVVRDAAVFSNDDFGSERKIISTSERFFSVRSPFYFPALLVFWWEASSNLQRLTILPRLLIFFCFPNLRKPSA